MNKLLILIIAGLALGACSVKRTAVNIIGDALSGRGGVYPKIIGTRVPADMVAEVERLRDEHRALHKGQ